MSKDPALLWYPADYVAGTMGMSFEQKGAYMDLLMMQFNQGHLTESMILNHISTNLWQVIRPKFDLDERGHYFKKRIDEEKQKRINFTESRRNNKDGINQHTKKRSHDQVLTGHMVNVNENISKDLFNVFWLAYPKKKNKGDAEKAWKVIKPNKELTETMVHKIGLLKTTKDWMKDGGQFIPYPASWLRSKGWEDDILVIPNMSDRTLRNITAANNVIARMEAKGEI